MEKFGVVMIEDKSLASHYVEAEVCGHDMRLSTLQCIKAPPQLTGVEKHSC